MGKDRLGILLILLGMSFFSIQDVLIKIIILDASLLQILVFRAALGTIILVCFLYFFLNFFQEIFKLFNGIIIGARVI